MAAGSARYRRAYRAGASGAKLPEGLASMADQDPKIDAAHDAGRNGASYDEFAREHLGEDGATGGGGGGPRPRRRPTRSPGLPTPTRPLGRNVPVGVGGGASVAGVFLGAIVYALILSVVDYGSKGPGMWFKAKFENEVTTSSGSAASGTTVTPAAPINGNPALGYAVTPTLNQPGGQVAA